LTHPCEKRWKETHREMIRAEKKEEYQRNKETILAKVKIKYEENKAIFAARNKVRYLEKAKQCEICDSAVQLESHHPDYAEPLIFVTLCRLCHSAIHRQKVMGE